MSLAWKKHRIFGNARSAFSAEMFGWRAFGMSKVVQCSTHRHGSSRIEAVSERSSAPIVRSPRHLRIDAPREANFLPRSPPVPGLN